MTHPIVSREDPTAALGADAVADVVRVEYGRVVAGLIRRYGDFGLAEDALGEAIVIALKRWPQDGVPPHPAGWLTTTASRKALDHLRREQVRDEKYAEAAMLTDDTLPEPTGPVTDDRLCLMFTCCHPALGEPARVALTLRLLGGLTVAEIASAFLVPETTMAQRITRAKAKIAKAGIPYRVPEREDLTERLDGVLAVLYLVYNEGYLSSTADNADRQDLAEEATRLTRAVQSIADGIGSPPEVDGLLALMLLTQARRPARIATDGAFITLDEQDRTRWDADLIDEGHTIVRGCLRRNAPGPYQLQAAIQAVHTDALDASLTDWGRSSRSTTSSCRCTPRMLSRSTGQSPSLSSTDPWSPWPSSTDWSSRHTHRGTQTERTCCAGWDGRTTQAMRMPPPSRPRRIPPNVPGWHHGGTGCLARRPRDGERISRSP